MLSVSCFPSCFWLAQLGESNCAGLHSHQRFYDSSRHNIRARRTILGHISNRHPSCGVLHRFCGLFSLVKPLSSIDIKKKKRPLVSFPLALAVTLFCLRVAGLPSSSFGAVYLVKTKTLRRTSHLVILFTTMI